MLAQEGIITACVNGENGNTRIVTSPADCREPEYSIQWNISGPSGLPGYPGPQGPAGQDGATGPQGMPGYSTLFNVALEPAGINCAYGGQRIDIGLDNGDNGGITYNGLLEAGEIDTTPYLCNGAAGATGPEGPQGATGEQGPAGLACWDTDSNGIFTLGEDKNLDGLLDAADCQGPPGVAGIDGTDGQDGAQGPAGISCWDSNHNGIGDGDEDRNGDTFFDTLDCQGPQGATGLAGTDGEDGTNGVTALLSLQPEPSGENCLYGGQRVNVGLDNGANGGIAHNRQLEAGEITTFQYVCHGAPGSAGLTGQTCPSGGVVTGFHSSGTLICASLESTASEACDGLDNNLNGLVDEDLTYCFGGSPAEHTDGVVCIDSYADNDGILTNGCETQIPQPEVCDGLDNDLDGIVDDGLV